MSFVDILRYQIEILVGPLITRHLGMGQIRLRIAQPRGQPIGIHLASHFGEFRPNVTADQFGFARAGDRQRMAGGAEHLPEARFALIDRSGRFSHAATILGSNL